MNEKPTVYDNWTLRAPMRRVVEELKLRGVDLMGRVALEFFAREGDWQTVSYASEVAELHAWEIDPVHEAALRANLPEAHVRIGDAFQLATLSEFAARFDFINIDNPQVTFGDHDQYCDHFEVLALVRLLMRPRVVLIFDVNYKPYDYDRLPEWKRRRDVFYGVEETAILEFDFIGEFYTKYFHSQGLKTHFVFVEDRHDGHFAYCVMDLEKV